MSLAIPPHVIEMLPVYARALAMLQTQGRDSVSANELGMMVGIFPSQIRKDLSYFGRFGRQSKGYDVDRLLQELAQLLGHDRVWSMILIGVGRLGRAVLANRDLQIAGFIIVDALDIDEAVVRNKVEHVEVRPIASLQAYLSQRQIDIGIVAVPADQARSVITELAENGVTSILNYSSTVVSLPPHVRIHNVDPVLILQGMAFYLMKDRYHLPRLDD
jgi:redox-sensing transcriptional repressor